MSALMSLFSCNEFSEPELDSLGYEYYPLEIGSFREYTVREIIWSVASVDTDTLDYDLREVVYDSLGTEGSETTFVLQRYKRFEGQTDWELDSIWTTYRNDFQAVVNENNIPRMKLVFPVVEDKTWDSNSLNSVDRDDFRMVNVESAFQGDLQTFDNTLRVVQEEKLDSLIELDNRYEIFALGIGLIEKVDSRIKWCQDNDCFGLGEIDEGRTLVQKLTDYGTE